MACFCIVGLLRELINEHCYQQALLAVNLQAALSSLQLQESKVGVVLHSQGLMSGPSATSLLQHAMRTSGDMLSSIGTLVAL